MQATSNKTQAPAGPSRWRELDARHLNRLTVTLQWSPVTGQLRILAVNDLTCTAANIAVRDPADARFAFHHPFTYGTDAETGRVAQPPAVKS